MKKFILSIFLCLPILGCANFNPRMQNKIDNQNGKIDEIKNNQNELLLEIGKLRQAAEIQNSQIKEFQQGMLNFNASGIRNENKGIQILQGDGPLLLIFALGTIGMLLFYKKKSDKNEKIANVLAKEIMKLNDQSLNDNIFRSSMNTNFEKDVYNILNKNLKKSFDIKSL